MPRRNNHTLQLQARNLLSTLSSEARDKKDATSNSPLPRTTGRQTTNHMLTICRLVNHVSYNFHRRATRRRQYDSLSSPSSHENTKNSMNKLHIQPATQAPLRPAALMTVPLANWGNVLFGAGEDGAGKKPAPTNHARYLPISCSETVNVHCCPCERSSVIVLVASSSGALVLVGKSSRTKWRSGKRALSWTSMTCCSSLRRHTRYSHCCVGNPYSANDERMLLKVGGGTAVMCSTLCAAFGRGSTAARAVQRATSSTGTMFTVLLISGTKPSWTHPLNMRQIKSSVLVTMGPHSQYTNISQKELPYLQYASRQQYNRAERYGPVSPSYQLQRAASPTPICSDHSRT